MKKRMLIDATHDEEVRVAVIGEDRLEEYDYESKSRKPLKGNIFLAKVTRVEPSLQAAFVNFGGNRHGFLPFSEIHPDYFRIPISDREALIAEQERAIEEAEAEEEDLDSDVDADSDDAEIDSEEGAGEEAGEDNAGEEDENASEDEDGNKSRRGRGRGRGGRGRGRGGRKPHRSRRDEAFDDDEADQEQRFRFNLRRKYKIQEVIKRGQIMLVQVSKEERGNKGAAVGSYLSLPGRYCVLMPNSPRAGGISRKIANYKDRARMRDLIKELNVPKGMSVIVRTAGVERTKAEIKRDLEYLMRLWDNIRELTLESTAPALVYEEADLIKRSVRDLYTRDVEEVIVAGDEGYKSAKNFMKMMIPSHAKRVKEYDDSKLPLFNKYQVESQIAEIGETQVTLPSGGYLVINPTEALVSVDVNSGKATKERHIEETALKTNLEAATEVARQLRLRDLGGLVVVDFIDMEDRRNNGKVERRIKDALSGDRARIQVGRISSFGLMELSRQRLNPSLTESQFENCPSCAGTGRVRTADGASIMVLRAIEEEGAKKRASQVILHVSQDVALYLLNFKRTHISDLEKRHNFEVMVRVDDTLGASTFRLEVSKPLDKGDDGDEGNINRGDRSDHNDRSDDETDSDRNRGGRRRGRRGGRRRNMRRDDDQTDDNQDQDDEDVQQSASADSQPDESADDKKDEKPKRRPARSRKKPDEQKDDQDKSDKQDEVSDDDAKDDVKPDTKAESEEKPKAEKPKRASRAPKKTAPKDDIKEDASAEDEKPKKTAKKAPASKSAPKKTSKKVSASNDDKPEENPPEYENVNPEPDQKKKGWWNKLVD